MSSKTFDIKTFLFRIIFHSINFKPECTSLQTLLLRMFARKRRRLPLVIWRPRAILDGLPVRPQLRRGFRPSDSDFIIGDGKTHFLEYDQWKGGVRGWFGWNWAFGWDLKIIYTWFRNRAKGKVDTDGHTHDLKASLFHPDSDEENA